MFLMPENKEVHCLLSVYASSSSMKSTSTMEAALARTKRTESTRMLAGIRTKLAVYLLKVSHEDFVCCCAKEWTE
jgi:hypothetical protein